MTLQEYLQGLGKVVSLLVGDKLSTVKGASGDVPSVFIARQKPPKPIYPYGVIDYIGKGNYGSKELYSEFSDAFDTQITYFNRRLSLRVAFYGNYGDNILDTAERLGMWLKAEKGRELLSLHMPNAGLMNVSEPSYNDNLLTTDYEEFTALTIDLWVISEVSNENFYNIASGNVSGSYYINDENQQPDLTL